MATLNLRKFDVSRIKKGNNIVMIGKKNTGKSFLAKKIIYELRDIPIACVISPTEEANHFYGDMMPPIFIHGDYSAEIISKLVQRQKLIGRKIDKQLEQCGRTDIDPNCLLILDDCMYNAKEWGNDTNMKRIFMNGRHHNITMLITLQFSLGINTSARSNIDFIFILRENFISNRKRLYEHYAGMFPSFDIFNQVMDQCTEDFHCLVIDNTSTSNKVEDSVFWYKADPTPKFTLGAEKFWQYSNANYSEDGDMDENAIENLGKKKNATHLTVKKTY